MGLLGYLFDVVNVKTISSLLPGRMSTESYSSFAFLNLTSNLNNGIQVFSKESMRDMVRNIRNQMAWHRFFSRTQKEES